MSDADQTTDERTLFERGISLFNAGDYFEAHEAWEAAWHQASGERADFYQGLVQCAVALEHVRRGNPRGAITVFARAKRRLEKVTNPYMGLDWVALVRRLSALLGPLEQLPAHRLAPRQHGQTLPVDLTEAPRIQLVNDSVNE